MWNLEITAGLLVAGTVAGVIGVKFWRKEQHAPVDISKATSKSVEASATVQTEDDGLPSTVETLEKAVGWLETKGKAEAE